MYPKLMTIYVLAASVSLAAVARAQSYASIYSFRGQHGASPYTGLTEFDGKLYGVTANGGSKICKGGCGVVFSIDVKTGKEKVVYAFQNGADGASPMSGLTVVGSLLYGTTTRGGGGGTVFSFDPSTNTQKVVHTFEGSDGASPSSALIEVASVLYGETSGGGTGSGTVYSIDPSTGAESVVYAFQGNHDGTTPVGGVIEVAGLLYGATVYGGAVGDGTVFSVDPSTGAEKVVHSFGMGEDGIFPGNGLTQVGKLLYGTTDVGGAYRGGTAYSINLGTGKESVVHSFGSGSDGSLVYSSLINFGGMLYGTSFYGGSASCGCGTIFSIDLATHQETVAYSFEGRPGDGSNPYDALIAVNGTLYGTTGAGGAANRGTAFAFTP